MLIVTINILNFRSPLPMNRLCSSFGAGLASCKPGKSMAKSLVLGLVIFISSVLPQGLAALTTGSTAANSSVISNPPVSKPADVQNERLAKLEQQLADSKGSADNAWMLTSAALVLVMTGPGLARFYGGVARRKKGMASLMQGFALLAAITVLCAVV